MFIETFVTAALGLGMQTGGELVHSPNGADLARAALRWSHLVAGVAWVGLLYFFNLVNVPTMAALDGPTKSKVIPELMPRALWYFRWGAAATVLAGAVYYAVFILSTDAANAGVSPVGPFMHWFGTSIIFYAFIYALYMVPALNKDGRLLAVAVAVVVAAMLFVLVKIMGGMGTEATGRFMGNKSLSIAAGGGLGMVMLLNVWGVIWRCQKRIIEAVKNGETPPADLARKAFLASRTNFWLSFPMLFFMGTSHGDWVMFGK
jgi:uncharacterized membrane protein